MRKKSFDFKAWFRLLLLFSIISIVSVQESFSQKKEITGSVRDSTGAGLSGVSVSLKNVVSVGTSTDVNGRFILEVPNENAVLVFTIVGYTPEEIPLEGRQVLNVIMKSTSAQLEQVVVMAFGEKRGVNEVVGSVTTIRPGELKVPSSNLTTALAGRAAGIIAYQRSGEPGQDNADFFIRGVTTFG